MKTRFLIILALAIMGTVPFVTFAALDRYENYLEQLEYERQRIENEPKPGERSYIEPELKAKLEGVELDLREKVRQLHEDLPPSLYAVNLNHQTKEIEAVIENKELIPIIKEFTKKYSEDIVIVVEYGTISMDGFNFRLDDDSDPICFKINTSVEKLIDGEPTEMCFTSSEFEEMGCTKPMLEHILRYSNLLDYEVDGLVYLEWAGLPSGVSQGEFDECYNTILEKRPIPDSKNQEQQDTCPDGQNYDKVLFKCVISCKDGLVYNGYTDSCTTEFELKYHGYCDEGLTYSPSLHVCLGNDPDIQITPLKDPPRTSPPEPEPVPMKCKSGPAPSDGYYFDEKTCKWKEIENEN